MNIQNISEKYAGAPWARALMNLVPSVGGSIDILLTSRHDQLAQLRIEMFISEFGRQIEALEKEIDQDVVRSEDFHDIFVTALERTTRIGQSARIEAVAKIVAESATGLSDVNSVHPTDLVNALAEMSNQEALVLGAVIFINYNKTHVMTGTNGDLMTIDDIKEELPAALKASADFLCSRLVGRGFIESGYSYFALSFAGKKIKQYLDIPRV